MCSIMGAFLQVTVGGNTFSSDDSWKCWATGQTGSSGHNRPGVKSVLLFLIARLRHSLLASAATATVVSAPTSVPSQVGATPPS